MDMVKLEINTQAVKDFSKTLKSLSRSALPIAIRGALNDAAYHTKTVTLLEEADHTFKKRDKNFFRANSKYEKATGFDVDKMIAKVGMVTDFLKGENNFAVKDLEEQEFGGDIKGRSFIPLKQARVGNSFNKRTRPANRISDLKNRYKNARKAPGKSRGQRFAQSLAFAGVGGFVLSEENSQGKRYIFRVNSLNRGKYGKFKFTQLYSYKKRRIVNISHGREFVKKASLRSQELMEGFYIKQAKRQIEKYMKKFEGK